MLLLSPARPRGTSAASTLLLRCGRGPRPARRPAPRAPRLRCVSHGAGARWAERGQARLCGCGGLWGQDGAGAASAQGLSTFT